MLLNGVYCRKYSYLFFAFGKNDYFCVRIITLVYIHLEVTNRLKTGFMSYSRIEDKIAELLKVDINELLRIEKHIEQQRPQQ